MGPGGGGVYSTYLLTQLGQCGLPVLSTEGAQESMGSSEVLIHGSCWPTEEPGVSVAG